MKDEFNDELLSAYLDGELTPAERAQVEQLLASSPAARQLLGELRALGGALKSLPRQKLDEDLSASILRMAEQRKLSESGTPETSSQPLGKTVFRRLKNPRVWVWEAVIVAVAVLLMVFYHGQNVPPAGQAQRQIALAAKPTERFRDKEEAQSIRAVPGIAAADRLDGTIRSKVAETPLEESKRAGSALADKQPAPPSVGKESLTWNIEGQEKIAASEPAGGGGKSAFDTDRPAKKQGPGYSNKAIYKGLPPAAAAMPPFAPKSPERKKSDVQSTDKLLVVRCEITPEAVKNRAFEKLLASNGIVWSEAPAQNRPVENRPKLGTVQSRDEFMARQPAGETRAPVVQKDIPIVADQPAAEPLEVVYVEASPAQVNSTLKELSAQNNLFRAVSITRTKDNRQFDKFAQTINRRRDISDKYDVIRGGAAELKTTTDLGLQTSANPPSSTPAATISGRALHVQHNLWDDAARYALQMEDQMQHVAESDEKSLSESNSLSKSNNSGTITGDRLGGQTYGGFTAGMGGAAQSTSTAAETLNAPARNFDQSRTGEGGQMPAAAGARLSAKAGAAQTAKTKEAHQKIPEAEDKSGAALFAPHATPSEQAAQQPQMQRVLFVMRLSERQGSTNASKSAAAAGKSEAKTAPAQENSPAETAPAGGKSE